MNSPLELTLWQKKQATLFYHFASLDYFKGLQQRVNELITVAESTLDQAKAENRDALLTDQQWGTRNTSANWANVAWPFLASFRKSNAWHIANRPFEVYGITGANHCARAMDEFSMQWATPHEEKKFKETFEAVYQYQQHRRHNG